MGEWEWFRVKALSLTASVSLGYSSHSQIPVTARYSCLPHDLHVFRVKIILIRPVKHLENYGVYDPKWVPSNLFRKPVSLSKVIAPLADARKVACLFMKNKSDSWSIDWSELNWWSTNPANVPSDYVANHSSPFMSWESLPALGGCSGSLLVAFITYPPAVPPVRSALFSAQFNHFSR